MNFISLTENHLFSKAYRSPKRYVTKTLAVYVLKDRHEKRLRKENPMKESLNRVGISASKKVGGAVERNRAKRVVREAYRQTDLECGIKRGYIIVIAARERATVVKMQDAMSDLRHALTKLDMLILPDGRASADCSDKGAPLDRAADKAEAPEDSGGVTKC